MKKYDLHLSAKKISKSTIKAIEKLGFNRDVFANNRHCDTTMYHGTYRGNVVLPDKKIWKSICQLLNNDTYFEGTLEEEEYETDRVFYFENTIDISFQKQLLPKFITTQPLSGKYKACDIHIGVNLNKSSNDCINALEALATASFDKPKENSIYRIYTITTENIEDGYKICSFLKAYFSDGFSIQGKIKLEKTTRHYRKPSLVNTLPLVTTKEVNRWFKKINIKV
jgi:hypothetical protein